MERKRLFFCLYLLPLLVGVVKVHSKWDNHEPVLERSDWSDLCTWHCRHVARKEVSVRDEIAVSIQMYKVQFSLLTQKPMLMSSIPSIFHTSKPAFSSYEFAKSESCQCSSFFKFKDSSYSRTSINPSFCLLQSIEKKLVDEAGQAVLTNFVSVSQSMRYPGTLWCGKGFRAEKISELGAFSATDNCCRWAIRMLHSNI